MHTYTHRYKSVCQTSLIIHKVQDMNRTIDNLLQVTTLLFRKKEQTNNNNHNFTDQSQRLVLSASTITVNLACTDLLVTDNFF